MAIPSVSAGGAVAAGLAVAVAGLITYGAMHPPPAAPPPEAAAPSPEAAAAPDAPSRVERAPPDAAPGAETAAAGSSAPSPSAPGAEPSAAGPALQAPAASGDAAAAPGPSFDLVRVAPDGSAVVAGRAEPGARVTIHGAEGAVAETEADAAGDFVAVFRTAPGTEPQALTLEAEDAEGDRTVSEDVVVLLPDAPAPEAAGAAPDASAGAPPAAADVAAAPAEAVGPTADAPAGTPPAAPAAEGPAAPAAEGGPATVAATAVLRGDEGVEATPVAPGAGLALASISYQGSGLVTLAGIGAAGARLRAYVDDRFALEGAVGADGRWMLELDDVKAGIYRLRIDALRSDGTVESRIETPFQRDFPAAPDGSARPGAITVQPGNNLWTIARTHYGAGVLYTQIHTANRHLIRDPELIYPGQIFVLPEAASAD